MEVEEAHLEMQAVLRLYALLRWIGEANQSTQSETSAPCPYLDKRSFTLLQDLLDRKMESTIANLSRLVTTADTPTNQPPPPSPLLKRQCSHCQQRTGLSRQASMKIPETDQMFVRSDSSRAINSTSRIRNRRTEDSVSEFSSSSYCTTSNSAGSCYSSSSCSSTAVRRPIPREGHGRGWGRARSSRRSISYSSRSSFSSYSSYSSVDMSPPCRRPTPMARAWGWGRDKIRTRIKKGLGQLFHHRRHHHGGGLLRQAKEFLQQPRRKRPKKPMQPQRVKSRPKRLHWWQLRRRTRTKAAGQKPSKEAAAGRKPKGRKPAKRRTRK